jgi:hypothetical protein
MTMMQQAAARTSGRWSGSARPTRHSNFQHYLETFGLMTMLGFSANLLAAPVARAESPGNFSGSCKNLGLNATNFSKTAMLTADCRRQDGTYLKAEVNLNDLITNNHGSLQWGRPGGADFQQSCSGDALSGSKLTSSCVASPEVNKSTQIDLNEKITNDNGKLTYISDPKSPGDFSGSCKNFGLNATNFSKTAMLTADCRRKDGTYLKSEVNLNDLITNNHGSLQWGHPGGADFQQSCSGDVLSGNKLTSSCVASLEVKKSTQIDLNEKITNDNGKLTYIGDEKVVVDPGPPPPQGPTMADLVGIAWGVDENGSAQAELLDKIVNLGLHRVRVDFPWDLIEPNKGQWNWGRYEDFVAAAARRHVDILGILDYGVKWANTGVYPPKGDSKAPPDDFKDFTDYAKAVVEHFKGRPGAPKAYEIWNEPNAGALNWHEPTCQSHTIRGSTTLCPSTGVSHAPRHEATGVYGDADLFGALTAASISTIKGDKQLGQDIPLLAPGGTVFLWEPFVVIAGNESGPDFMNDAFKTNPQLASLSDAVTLHGYDAYPPSSEPENALPESGTINVQLGDKIAKMKATFTAHGTSPSKPVWLTEIGWPTSSVDETAQARWLIRSIMLAALNGVDRMYIYKMYDGPSASAEDHFGLVGQDRNAKKKAYLAIQRFMQELGSLRVQSRIPAHDVRNSAYIVQLADGSGPQAWVVWDSASDHGGNFFRWKLPANTSCEGMFGEPCAFSPNGELEATAEPVYVVATPRLTRGPR